MSKGFYKNRRLKSFIFLSACFFIDLENNKSLNICGHYHPKIHLKNNGDKLSFRCFAMDNNKNVLYLPAFGDLTGGYPCKKTFKKWAIVSEEEIIEIKS